MTGFEPAHPWTGFEPDSPHPEGRELPLSLHGALPLSHMALKIIVQEVVVNWRMVARLVVTNNLVLKGTLLDQTKKQPNTEVIKNYFYKNFCNSSSDSNLTEDKINCH